MKKASPELKELVLYFSPYLQTVNPDSCLDIIFGLDQITTLLLLWDRMSLDKIKSSLRKQRGKKRWERVALGRVHQEVNDADVLEICSYLPSLRSWYLICQRFTLTVDGAREWKRICPNLETVKFVGGGGLSEEVKEVLKGLGVTVN
jgi:hypothetical protein